MGGELPVEPPGVEAPDRPAQANLVLKEGDTFIVMDAFGDVNGGVDATVYCLGNITKAAQDRL